VRSRGLPDDHVGPVRVVDIEGIDSNMCCGTHVSNLSDLQVGAAASLPSGTPLHAFTPRAAEVPEIQGLLEIVPMVKGAAEAVCWVSPSRAARRPAVFARSVGLLSFILCNRTQPSSVAVTFSELPVPLRRARAVLPVWWCFLFPLLKALIVRSVLS